MLPNPNERAATSTVTPAVAVQQPDETVAESTAGGHFDTFETDFFRAGDENGGSPDACEYDDDRRRPHLLSRRSLLGLTIGSSCLAVLACTALWRSNGPLPALPDAPATPHVAAHAAATAPSPTPAPVAPPPAVAAAPAGAAALPTTVAAAPPPAEPPPAAAAAPTPAVAAAPLAAAPMPAPSPAAEQVAEEPAAAPDETPQAAPTATASAAQERCQRSIREKRSKDILAACPVALAEGPAEADVAVALAKVEFDRGHFAQAYTWSKRAIAINPDSADAYVFAGGAEQSKGHGKAAKEAYLHYLRLAPSGRYAAELRAIVRSL